MSCPYLKEVRMVFCRAYPVKKLVPLDQLVSASSCETACAFEGCAAYRDARALVVQAADEAELVEALTSQVPEPSGKGRTP
jgi:hypothetical protein